VYGTLVMGQVNLLLLAMVLHDCVAPRTLLPRGVLVGVATAVKLTPGLFVVYLALTGRRRAALTAAGVAAGASALGFAVAPGQSWGFWTRYVFDTRRVGRTTYVANQSLRGLLARAFGSMDPPTALWLLLAVATVGAGLFAAARLHRRGEVLLGACACGVAGLLVSPISWNHHWVWSVPVALVLWFRLPARIARGGPRALAAPAGWTLLFLLGPMWWVAHDGIPLGYRSRGPQDVLLADAYVLAGLALVAWLVVSVRRPAPAVPTRRPVVTAPDRGGSADASG
jgi:alpha-1,2-mannosyltransferase